MKGKYKRTVPVINTEIKNFFQKNILKYFYQNARDLPWRNIKDPYKIWLSEIILQQTQVVQGLPYYLSFIKKYPDVKQLASAKEDDILHLWQGLGYYSRARNLHFAAKQIIEKFQGKFPNSYGDIKSLKGIGDYTAAAIASIAFQKPFAVLDGNVFRVVGRFFGVEVPIDTTDGKKLFKTITQDLLDKENPGDYNQAIMEFGATYCKPINPDCLNCCLNKYCIAFQKNKVAVIPIKSKQLKKRQRYFDYIIFRLNNKVLIKKRKSDIWKGLYEFYLIESDKQNLSKKTLLQYMREKQFSIKNIILLGEHKHILTHQYLFIQFWIVELKTDSNMPKEFIAVDVNKLEKYPFPIVIKRNIKRVIDN